MTVIATHNGTFHADDVFAAAVLLTIFGNDSTVLRTREPELIQAADFAVDVGGIYEPGEGRFDHHQKGFSVRRLSEEGYASAGLVWLHHGLDCIYTVCPELRTLDTLAVALQIRQTLDKEFVRYIDMADTGEANVAPGRFGFSALINVFVPSRSELLDCSTAPDPVKAKADLFHKAFMAAVEQTQILLRRMIEQEAAAQQAKCLVRQGNLLEGGRILVLTAPNLNHSWQDVVCTEMPEVLYVVYKDSSDVEHHVQVVPVTPHSFVARKSLPEAWAGLRGADLAAVTGVEDAVFCHVGRFIGGAKSLEGTLALARIAVNS